MKLIPLTQGKFAQVDNEDFERLSQYKWQYHHGYACRQQGVGAYKHKEVWMHREIIHTPDNMQTDHIDMNKLNNQKSNLRICTSTQNQANRKIRKDNKSGYKGIFWREDMRQWQAYISIDRKRKHLGYYDDAKDAAKAYDDAARKYFGSFAYLNFEEKNNG